MAFRRNTDHVNATHVESVPRRYDRLDLMMVTFSGRAFNERALDAMIAARATRQNVDIVMKRRQSRG